MLDVAATIRLATQVKFECNDGCTLPNSTRNDNKCDCTGCEDEDRWDCTTCDCIPTPVVCGITGIGCGPIDGDLFFACERCWIPYAQKDDGECNCEECAALFLYSSCLLRVSSVVRDSLEHEYRCQGR